MSMTNLSNSIFNIKNPVSIPENSQIVFVSDFFSEELTGGAELTSEALITSSPYNVYKLHSSDVTLELLRDGKDKYWIFGNFTKINSKLIPSIVANMKYSIIEYDFKFCKFRSPERHQVVENVQCDCHQQMNGKIISAFFYGANCIWWMSERQMGIYHERFPFLVDRQNIVLSSVFSKETLAKIKLLRENNTDEKHGCAVLDSPSWIKAANDAKLWCKSNNKQVNLIWNKTYDECLATLSASEELVYLPSGSDTCPRFVIEAKLLGCKLHLNDNVLHKDEEWFTTDNLNEIEEYLLATPKLFWSTITNLMNYTPTISGYLTTYNCVDQQYPFENCIKSMMQFCDEICIVDGGSTDTTWEKLVRLAHPDAFETDKLSDAERDRLLNDLKMMAEVSDYASSPLQQRLNPTTIKLQIVKRDWSHPRHAVFDGMQKAEARLMCTKEFCWQMDSDEIVHESDAYNIKKIASKIPKKVDIVALPVIEYWGGPNKIRMDVTPWKWRLSRNNPKITHGIPSNLIQSTSDDGLPIAMPGTDGCDLISAKTGLQLPFLNFYTQEIDNLRKIALLGNEDAKKQYEIWFNQVIKSMPCVFHYSWFDLERKIKLYRDYWQNHWNALYGKDTSDVPENNMMFDFAWSDVTDQMIKNRAKLMSEKLGGWIWHTKWNGVTETPHIVIDRTQPKLMLDNSL